MINNIKCNIRNACVEDAHDISNVHVESWMETYTGIISDAYLSSLSKLHKQTMWEEILSQNLPKHYNFVAEFDGKVIGFVTGGPAREKNLSYDGELYALYLLKAFHGHGIGKSLFQKLTNSLIKEKMKSMYLWAVRENKATEFYHSMGGFKGTSKMDKIEGENLLEDLYFWRFNDFELMKEKSE